MNTSTSSLYSNLLASDLFFSVISINAHSAKLANSHLPPEMDDFEPPSSGGGFFSGLLKLIFFGAVCAVGYVAWKAYQAKKGNPFDAKRF